MIGIIVQLALSWLIVWIVEKRNLSVLGLFPTKRRLLDFIVFFLITAACCASDFIMRMLFAEQQWKLNPNLSFKLILEGVWWNIKSVMFEELIFRGVLLYILIKKIGPVKAIIISAIAFGIYHWFSFEAFGNPVQMIFVFLTTGIMGLLYAYGYARSFSLYIPIAIHLGWNLTRSIVFSETVIGDQLLVQVKPVPQVQVSYFTYYLVTFFPMLTTLLINFFILKKKKQAVSSSAQPA
jgi:membrane protease YdiL (CAAX protease family)